MKNIFRTSIAARSAAVILAIVAVVGFSFLGLAIPFIEKQETAAQWARLNELLDTVQRTVSIACFLSDKQLADEVARGLLSNRTVSEVTISIGEENLAHSRRDSAAGSVSNESQTNHSRALARNVPSPFNSDQVVCLIALTPDAAEIRSDVLRASLFTGLLLVGQVIVLGIGVAVVVIRLVTRPISTISSRLHKLRAETGQKLDVPKGNEMDEIGQLVRDVNSMADYLVKILDDERSLRLEREVGEKKFRAIFEHAHTGIFQIDEFGMLISYNRACAKFFGVSEILSTALLPTFIDMFEEHRPEARTMLERAVSGLQSVEQDLRIGGNSGAPARWLNVVLSPIQDHRLQGIVNDVTERKRAEEVAHELAVTDRLTDLSNRLGFERKLEQMFEEAFRNRDYRFALLMLDLDLFKAVNDTYGHKAGDQVLIHVARTLEKVVRKSDFVGRLGGDEFVILLDSISERGAIEQILAKVITGIGQPVAIEGGIAVTVGVSIGVALFEGGAMTKDQLMQHADEAMYHAKQAGRNIHRFFEDGKHRAAKR